MKIEKYQHNCIVKRCANSKQSYKSVRITEDEGDNVRHNLLRKHFLRSRENEGGKTVSGLGYLKEHFLYFLEV
jgi:hypothetical protein